MYDWAVLLAAPLIRNLSGWLHNATEDGKISPYEWSALAGTTLKILVPAVALYYGFDMDAEMAAAIPLLTDLVFSEMYKTFNIAPEAPQNAA